MKRTKKTVDNRAEREAVGRVLEICNLLKIEPEVLGLGREREDAEYHLTYKTCRIMDRIVASFKAA